MHANNLERGISLRIAEAYRYGKNRLEGKRAPDGPQKARNVQNRNTISAKQRKECKQCAHACRLTCVPMNETKVELANTCRKKGPQTATLCRSGSAY